MKSVKKKITATYLPEALTVKVKVFAAGQRRTVSEVVGTAITEYLDKQKAPKRATKKATL